MNMLRIAGKELKVFRDIKVLVFMLATPVLLMLILGTALSGNFNGTAAMEPIRVLYAFDGASKVAEEKWTAFLGEAEASGAVFEEIQTGTDGIREVENGNYTGYAVIRGSEGIAYYGNENKETESRLAEGLLMSFTESYNLVQALAGSSSQDRLKDKYVTGSQVEAAKKPGGLDYYAVAVTTMIILYSALTAGQLIETERIRHTDIRLLASPATKGDIFAGKILGMLAVNGIFVVLIMAVSKLMFQVNWGDRPGVVLIVLLTEVVFALSLGLAFGYVFKGNAAGSVLMIIIQAAAFFGGSYAPVDQTTGFMHALARYSPLQWSNDAILQVIYEGRLAAAAPAALLNLGWSVLLLAAAILLMRRREGL